MGSAARRVPALPRSLYANVQAFTPTPVIPPAPAPAAAAGPVVVPAHRAAAIAAHAAEVALSHKVDQFARIQDRGRARAEALAAQIKALQKRKAHVEARHQRHEDRFIAGLQAAGYHEIHGHAYAYSLKPAPLAVQILNESEIPDEYMRTTVVSAPDKVAIKAALQRGEAISGAALTQRVTLCRKSN